MDNLPDLSKLEIVKHLKLSHLITDSTLTPKTFEDVKITNEIISQEIRDSVNTKLEFCIDGHQNKDTDEELIMDTMRLVANLLKPYITWPELFETNFDAWECLVLEDYIGLKELEE